MLGLLNWPPLTVSAPIHPASLPETGWHDISNSVSRSPSPGGQSPHGPLWSGPTLHPQLTRTSGPTCPILQSLLDRKVSWMSSTCPILRSVGRENSQNPQMESIQVQLQASAPVSSTSQHIMLFLKFSNYSDLTFLSKPHSWSIFSRKPSPVTPIPFLYSLSHYFHLLTYPIPWRCSNLRPRTTLRHPSTPSGQITQ